MEYGRTVLVVEDSEDVRGPLCDIARMAGFTVFECGDGVTAMDIAENHEIHIVITDFDMPGMDGAAVARFMRKRFPPVFIVGMSAGDRSADFLAAGANVFLPKPYRLADVLRLLMDESHWDGTDRVRESSVLYHAA